MYGIGNALPRLQELVPHEGKCLRDFIDLWS